MKYFVYYVIIGSALQLLQPFGISDYPEAISFPCIAMLQGESPYSVVCTSGNSISPGPGYLFLLLASGLFLAPGLLPFIGIFLLLCATRLTETELSGFAIVVCILLLRSTILGIDYLFAGGALWLMLSLSPSDC